MPSPCSTCSNGVTKGGTICGECKRKDEERIPLGPDEDTHPLARGPDPETPSLLADQRRIIKDLQRRWRYEYARTNEQGRMIDRGLTKGMIQEAATISKMLTDHTDVYRKWVAAAKEAGGELTPAEQTEVAGDWLSSANVPSDEKRKQVARILASLGEVYETAPVH